jgi:hypothetical protein
MGLTNMDYGTTPLQRVLAAGIKRCQLGDLRDIDRPANENGEPGKGPLSKTIVNLTLEEPAKTTDGDEVQAGFPTIVSINVWEGREDEAKAQLRELALAVLGLERNSKENVVTKINERGGWSALKGKPLLVEFTVKKGFSDAKSFNRVPATPA